MVPSRSASLFRPTCGRELIRSSNDRGLDVGLGPEPMNKSHLVSLMSHLILAPVQITQAQQPKKVPRIGYLCPLHAYSLLARTEAFRQGLKEPGYIEGK